MSSVLSFKHREGRGLHQNWLSAETGWSDSGSIVANRCVYNNITVLSNLILCSHKSVVEMYFTTMEKKELENKRDIE